MEEELQQAFFKFATFGNRVVHNDTVLMDSRACQKLCRDAGLTGKKLTSTDVDIMFTRAKTKGERKINFAQFLKLLKMVSTKLNRLHADVAIQAAGSKPIANSSSLTKPLPSRKPNMTHGDRTQLSPPQQQQQVVRGAVHPITATAEPGRAMLRLHPDWYEVINPNMTCVADTYYYVNRKTQETTWTIPLLMPTSVVAPPPPPPPLPPMLSTTADISTKKTNSSSLDKNTTSSTTNGARAVTGAGIPSELVVEEKVENIFDRLTDHKLYTGAHKYRFDPKTGKGKGLEGRDRVAKGVGVMYRMPKSTFKGNTNTRTDETVYSISQFLRS